MSLTSQVALAHVEAAAATASELTALLRHEATGLAVPADIVEHLHVVWDQGTDTFSSGVDDPSLAQRLRDVEFGTQTKGPVALIRRFETKYARRSADLYETKLQRSLAKSGVNL